MKRLKDEAFAYTYGWDDLVDKPEPARIVIAWSCNCKEVSKKKQQFQGLTHMYPTEVVNDGVCKFCGHYAFRIDKKLLGFRNQRHKFSKF